MFFVLQNGKTMIDLADVDFCYAQFYDSHILSLYEIAQGELRSIP